MAGFCTEIAGLVLGIWLWNMWCWKAIEIRYTVVLCRWVVCEVVGMVLILCLCGVHASQRVNRKNLALSVLSFSGWSCPSDWVCCEVVNQCQGIPYFLLFMVELLWFRIHLAIEWHCSCDFKWCSLGVENHVFCGSRWQQIGVWNLVAAVFVTRAGMQCFIEYKWLETQGFQC